LGDVYVTGQGDAVEGQVDINRIVVGVVVVVVVAVGEEG